MKMFKKALYCLAVAALSVLMLSFTCSASENIGQPINLRINNNVVEGAFVVKGTAFAPYRTLVSAIDPEATFEWDGSIPASITYGTGVTIIAHSTKSYIEANDRIIYIHEVENMNLDGVLYVPVRSIARAYSLECYWDGESATAVVHGSPVPIVCGAEYYDETDLYWLSRIISAESRGEPFVGQIAVGNVVINRMNDGSFPDTIYDVVFDRRFGIQFTPAYSGSIYKTPTASSVLAAKIALEGVEVVDDALYFCTRSVSPRSWAQKNRPYATTIGDHVFYY